MSGDKKIILETEGHVDVSGLEEEQDELRDDGDDENDQELIEVSDDHPLAILKQYT